MGADPTSDPGADPRPSTPLDDPPDSTAAAASPGGGPAAATSGPDRPGGPGGHFHGHSHREHLHERLEELEEAAIAAEMATGRHEETVEEAKRSLVKRAIRISAGVVVTGFGVLLLALPGPGLLVVAAGLVILAQDVPFAARLLEKVRKRLPADADGKVPKSTIAMGLGISVLAVSGSLWWTFLR